MPIVGPISRHPLTDPGDCRREPVLPGAAGFDRKGRSSNTHQQWSLGPTIFCEGTIPKNHRKVKIKASPVDMESILIPWASNTPKTIGFL